MQWYNLFVPFYNDLRNAPQPPPNQGFGNAAGNVVYDYFSGNGLSKPMEPPVAKPVAPIDYSGPLTFRNGGYGAIDAYYGDHPYCKLTFTMHYGGLGVSGNCGMASLGYFNLTATSLRKDVPSFGDEKDFRYDIKAAAAASAFIADEKLAIEVISRHRLGEYAMISINDRLSFRSAGQHPFWWRTCDWVKWMMEKKIGDWYPGPIAHNPRYLSGDRHVIQGWWWIPPDSRKFLVREPDGTVIKAPAPGEDAEASIRYMYPDKVKVAA